MSRLAKKGNSQSNSKYYGYVMIGNERVRTPTCITAFLRADSALIMESLKYQ